MIWIAIFLVGASLYTLAYNGIFSQESCVLWVTLCCFALLIVQEVVAIFRHSDDDRLPFFAIDILLVVWGVLLILNLFVTKIPEPIVLVECMGGLAIRTCEDYRYTGIYNVLCISIV